MIDITREIKNLISTAHRAALNNSESNVVKQRLKAIEFYQGEQREYIKDYISFSNANRMEKMPYSYTNLTRKVINGVSLTYINPPERYINGERHDKYELWTEDKDFVMLEADRYTRLLDRTGIKVEWDAKRKKYKYRLLTEINVEYDQYEDEVVAVWFPIKAVGADRKDTQTIYEFWSAEQRMIIDGEGNPSKIQAEYGFENDLNPYGMIPVAVLSDDGIIAKDLINANEVINAALTELNDLIKFRAFGIPWIAGFKGQTDTLALNYNTVLTMTDPAAKAGMLETTVQIQQIVDAIKFQVNTVCENYGVSFNWGIQGDVSGFSLLVQNVELYDQIRVYNEKRRNWEQDIFDIERVVLEKDGKGKLDGEFSVDFAEYHIPVNKQDEIQWNEYRLRNGLASPVDLIMESNPDLTEEEARAIYEQNLADKKSITAAGTPESEESAIFRGILNG